MRPHVLAVFLLFSVILNAQFSLSGTGNRYYETYLRSSVAVQLTGCPRTDKELREAIAQHWRGRPVVYSDEIDASRIGSEAYPIVLHFNILQIDRERSAGVTNSYYINTWQITAIEPGRKRVTPNQVLACVPANCAPNDMCAEETPRVSCGSEVELAIIRLNEVMSFLERTGFTEKRARPFMTVIDYGKAYNEQQDAHGLPRKPLLVHTSMLSGVMDQEKFKTLYPYPFQVVDDATYWNHVNDQNTEYNYLMYAESPGLLLSVFDMAAMRTVHVDCEQMEVPNSGYIKPEQDRLKAKIKRLVKHIQSEPK
jgi:hypothetical protein